MVRVYAGVDVGALDGVQNVQVQESGEWSFFYGPEVGGGRVFAKEAAAKLGKALGGCWSGV
jgi:hypothetical protein